MTISYSETGESVLEPISFQDVYSRIWVRGGIALGLKMIPSFDGQLGSGIVMDQDNVHELEDEFESLKVWLESQSEPPYEFNFLQRHIGFLKRSAYRNWRKEKQYVLGRISHLQQVLHALKQNGSSFKIDIG